ncbi:hypothetical protein B0H14DRAFT_2691931, partial [Mycena olivaceomarginata]
RLTETDAPRSSRITTLKPFNTRTRSQTGSCDPGYSPCDSVSCCPTGDSCCSLSDGCCPVGYYCDLDGCCPNGKFCTGSSNECVNAGDFLCPDGDGCCRMPFILYSHSRAGSPPPLTTKTTTTKTTATTTKPDVSSTNITWTGSWLTVTSSCSSGKQAKKISGTASSFATGLCRTAVYVQVASTNAYYVVVIDEVDTSARIWPPGRICWRALHTEPSPESPDFDIPWSLKCRTLLWTRKFAKPSTSSGDGPGAAVAAVGGDSPDSAGSNHINFVAVVALTGFTFISLLL